MRGYWIAIIFVGVMILGLFLSPDVFAAKQAYKIYDLKSYNVGLEVDQYWRVLGIIDTDYYPGITLYEGWYQNWRNQLRLGLIHNVGQSINLENFDEVTQYFEDYQRQWCVDTKENPVWEVTPSETGWTTCLKMGNFTFNDVTVDGRQAYQASYQWTDEFRLPGGQYTKDVYSGWTYWANLIPYGDDLIFVSGYTINENVDEKKDIILHSLNSFKILNYGQPIFENTEPVSVTAYEPQESEIITESEVVAKTSSKTFIPGWIKQVAEFWISDQIDDAGFVQVIEYLVQQEIITIPYAEAPEGEAAVEIPSWIKMNAEFWVNGKTSDDEFATALEWLINNGIIRV